MVLQVGFLSHNQALRRPAEQLERFSWWQPFLDDLGKYNRTSPCCWHGVSSPAVNHSKRNGSSNVGLALTAGCGDSCIDGLFDATIFCDVGIVPVIPTRRDRGKEEPLLPGLPYPYPAGAPQLAMSSPRSRKPGSFVASAIFLNASATLLRNRG